MQRWNIFQQFIVTQSMSVVVCYFTYCITDIVISITSYHCFIFVLFGGCLCRLLWQLRYVLLQNTCGNEGGILVQLVVHQTYINGLCVWLLAGRNCITGKFSLHTLVPLSPSCIISIWFGTRAPCSGLVPYLWSCSISWCLAEGFRKLETQISAALWTPCGSRRMYVLWQWDVDCSEMFALAWFAESDSAVRQRKMSGLDSEAAGNDDKEVDELIRHHAEMQERIAEEMVHLARNLRENVTASGRVVRDDVKVCH